jgi:hypothetical protein
MKFLAVISAATAALLGSSSKPLNELVQFDTSRYSQCYYDCNFTGSNYDGKHGQLVVWINDGNHPVLYSVFNALLSNYKLYSNWIPILYEWAVIVHEMEQAITTQCNAKFTKSWFEGKIDAVLTKYASDVANAAARSGASQDLKGYLADAAVTTW